MSGSKSKQNLGEVMEFSDITQHPLMQPIKIDGVLAGIPHKKSSYFFTQRIPMVEVRKDTVEMDIVHSMNGGMTPMVAPNTSTPVFSEFSMGKREWEPGEFREKTQLDESHVRKLRRIGSLQELQSAARLMEMFRSRLLERLANTLEWQRREAVFSQALTVLVADGNVQTIPMPKPAYLRPTTLVSWDDPTATPTEDIQIWVSDMNETGAWRAREAVMPHRSLQKMTDNDGFNTIKENNYSVFDGTQQAVMSIISRYLGSAISLMENSDSVVENTTLVANAAAGSNTITIRSASMLSVGSTIVLHQDHQPLGVQELAEVQSLVKNADETYTVTLTANLNDSFVANDSVFWHLRLIPQDRMLLSGMLESDVETYDGLVSADWLNSPITFTSTLSNFRDLMGPGETGVWGFALRPKEDPPREEYLVGCRGLANIHYNTAWSSPKIFL